MIFGRKISEIDRARQALASRGLRATPQRLRVLTALRGIEAPVSHGELATRLGDDEMDRATVFRNLQTLVEAGLVRRTRMADGVFRFDLAGGLERHDVHPHLVCTDCGQVRCLPDDAVALKGGLGQVVEVQLRGRCVACLRA